MWREKVNTHTHTHTHSSLPSHSLSLTHTHTHTHTLPLSPPLSTQVCEQQEVCGAPNPNFLRTAPPPPLHLHPPLPLRGLTPEHQPAADTLPAAPADDGLTFFSGGGSHAHTLGSSWVAAPSPRREPIRLGCPPFPFPHSRSRRAHCRRGAQIHDLDRKNRFLRLIYPTIAGGALCLQPEDERGSEGLNGW